MRQRAGASCDPTRESKSFPGVGLQKQPVYVRGNSVSANFKKEGKRDRERSTPVIHRESSRGRNNGCHFSKTTRGRPSKNPGKFDAKNPVKCNVRQTEELKENSIKLGGVRALFHFVCSNIS